MNNTWYAVVAECIHEAPGIEGRLGCQRVIAKVETQYLAQIAANAIQEEIGRFFAVTVEELN